MIPLFSVSVMAGVFALSASRSVLRRALRLKLRWQLNSGHPLYCIQTRADTKVTAPLMVALADDLSILGGRSSIKDAQEVWVKSQDGGICT